MLRLYLLIKYPSDLAFSAYPYSLCFLFPFVIVPQLFLFSNLHLPFSKHTRTIILLWLYFFLFRAPSFIFNFYYLFHFSSSLSDRSSSHAHLSSIHIYCPPFPLPTPLSRPPRFLFAIVRWGLRIHTVHHDVIVHFIVVSLLDFVLNLAQSISHDNTVNRTAVPTIYKCTQKLQLLLAGDVLWQLIESKNTGMMQRSTAK